MMHGFPFSFGLLWLLLPIVAIGLGQHYIMRYFRVMRKRDHHSSALYGKTEDRMTEPELFRLAAKHGARLTVSDVVIALGLTIDEAERALDDLTDGVRVSMDISNDGITVYEFTELIRPSSPDRRIAR